MQTLREAAHVSRLGKRYFKNQSITSDEFSFPQWSNALLSEARYYMHCTVSLEMKFLNNQVNQLRAVQFLETFPH